MLYPEDIVSLDYDPESQRLTVAFDSCRKVVFYDVPPTLSEKIVDAPSREDGLLSHVVGKFAWTEIGALAPQEMMHASTYLLPKR